MKPQNKYEAAGQLLELAQQVIADKADHPSASTPLTELRASVIRKAAEVTADRGIDYGLGFIEGFWYVSGNHQNADGSSNNETWRAVRDILGEPVR